MFRNLCRIVAETKIESPFFLWAACQGLICGAALGVVILVCRDPRPGISGMLFFVCGLYLLLTRPVDVYRQWRKKGWSDGPEEQAEGRPAKGQPGQG